MRRLLAAVPVALLALALLAPVALAHDGGQGLYGEANDKVITNAGFIIIAFVPLFIGLMSVLQWRLDKRKKARLAAKRSRATSAEWHGGW
jgi:hypothetical protein